MGRERAPVERQSEAARFLIARSGARLCALQLDHVVETMRPLPVEALAGLPEFVLGMSIVRGVPVPVIDAGRLLGAVPVAAGRFVSLRLGAARGAALAVESVLGVQALSEAELGEMPPLLREAPAEVVSSVGRLDQELLLVLRGARLVPEAAWRALAAAGAGT